MIKMTQDWHCAWGWEECKRTTGTHLVLGFPECDDFHHWAGPLGIFRRSANRNVTKRSF